jgi:uncharacterized protein YjdB
MLKKAFSLVLAALLAAGLAMPALAADDDDSPRVQSIRLSNNSIRLEVDGNPMPLTVRFTPYDAEDDLEWSSSDEDVAVVDDGLVSAVGRGTATIYAETENGKRASCRVEVRDAGERDEVSRVKMNFDELTVRLGQTRQLMVSISPSGVDELDKYITWDSDDFDIADVEQDGTVYGVSLGTTTITATSDNGKRDTCRVTVVDAFDDGTGSASNSSGGTAANTKPAATSIVTGTLTDSAVRATVERVAKETAVGQFKSSYATFADSGIITPALMTTAAGAASGKNVRLRFTTKSEDAKQTGYLIVDPVVGRDLASSIYTGVHVDGENVARAKATFDKYYQNKTVAISLAQPTGYGMDVTVQAKVDLTGMKPENLVLYSYADGKVAKLSVPYSTDENGFLHFLTSTGGMIIVSDGALVKK